MFVPLTPQYEIRIFDIAAIRQRYTDSIVNALVQYHGHNNWQSDLHYFESNLQLVLEKGLSDVIGKPVATYYDNDLTDWVWNEIRNTMLEWELRELIKITHWIERRDSVIHLKTLVIGNTWIVAALT